jgi:hypothetical protein
MYGSKQTREPDKGNPSPGRRAPLGPIHPHSVVLGVVVGRRDVPSQGHLHWCSILCVPSWSWPSAWVLPLEFTLFPPPPSPLIEVRFSFLLDYDCES